jgi:hypothetical protein
MSIAEDTAQPAGQLRPTERLREERYGVPAPGKTTPVLVSRGAL